MSDFKHTSIDELVEDFAVECKRLGVIPKEIVFGEGDIDKMSLCFYPKTRVPDTTLVKINSIYTSIGKVLLTEQTKGDDNV